MGDPVFGPNPAHVPQLGVNQPGATNYQGGGGYRNAGGLTLRPAPTPISPLGLTRVAGSLPVGGSMTLHPSLLGPAPLGPDGSGGSTTPGPSDTTQSVGGLSLVTDAAIVGLGVLFVWWLVKK
jgi:hypothetical protein